MPWQLSSADSVSQAPLLPLWASGEEKKLPMIIKYTPSSTLRRSCYGGAPFQIVPFWVHGLDPTSELQSNLYPQPTTNTIFFCPMKSLFSKLNLPTDATVLVDSAICWNLFQNITCMVFWGKSKEFREWTFLNDVLVTCSLLSRIVHPFSWMRSQIAFQRYRIAKPSTRDTQHYQILGSKTRLQR